MNIVETESFKITNYTPEICSFRLSKPEENYTGFDTNYLILDLGEKEKGDFATCNFMFESDEYKITSTGSSCGCTNPTFQNTPDGQFVTVVFDSSKITKKVSKWFTLSMNNTVKKLKINLVINS